MKPLYKTLILFLIVVMLFTGCTGKKQGGDEETPTATNDGSTVDVTPSTEITGTQPPSQNTATPAPDGNGTATALPSLTLSPTNAPIENVNAVNLIPDASSNFNNVKSVSQTGWSTLGKSAKISISDEGYDDTNCLYFTKDMTKEASYHTPMLDLSKYITESGTYLISFKYMVLDDSYSDSVFYGVIRTGAETTFATKKTDGNIYCGLTAPESSEADEWLEYETFFTVSKSDIGKGAPWSFGFHMISETVYAIYIDDVTLTRSEMFDDEAVAVTGGQTWVANEAVFLSSIDYDDPFNDVDVDLLLTNGSVTYKIPCFWDGGKVWKGRFVCPSAGNWSYTTVCTDKSNTGLHNQKSSFKITKYSGNLDIYKHGFVTTKASTKYFVYADGTPFFYLGDTHWNFSGEPLSMVNTVVEQRVKQGYTVLQSEPLGANFSFTDGITTADITGLRLNDKRFKAVADAGLVHANAQFFFPSSMDGFILAHGGYSSKKVGVANKIDQYDLTDQAKKALEKISRYWVARYSAYPVMWTLGQEIDNDFYFDRKEHDNWSFVNNPYKYVAEYIYKYDPYKSPLTGHQEATSHTKASNSAFRDVEAHTWYGAQWSPSLKGASIAAVAQDFWNNGQGKPVVNYEGRYCYLWTKHFGARAQGWMAYLSGMFGYGYGAQDTWCYQSTYDETNNTNDGVDIITAEEKKNATWQDSLEYESSYQAGYMHMFFKNQVKTWYELVPRFDDTSFLTRESGAYAVVASNNDNSKIVAYFYNFSDTSVGQTPNSANGGAKTGTFKKLQANTKYNYMWFDPISGKTHSTGTFTSDANGCWSAGAKKTTDMVLYIYK